MLDHQQLGWDEAQLRSRSPPAHTAETHPVNAVVVSAYTSPAVSNSVPSPQFPTSDYVPDLENASRYVVPSLAEEYSRVTGNSYLASSLKVFRTTLEDCRREVSDL
jgi:hypothetical protein